MRQIILDTETTGLEWKKGNRVVEIGCVELMERRPTGNTYHCTSIRSANSNRARRK